MKYLLAVEGKETNGRFVAPGALTWETPIIIKSAQWRQILGTLHTIYRQDNSVFGESSDFEDMSVLELAIYITNLDSFTRPDGLLEIHSGIIRETLVDDLILPGFPVGMVKK